MRERGEGERREQERERERERERGGIGECERDEVLRWKRGSGKTVKKQEKESERKKYNYRTNPRKWRKVADMERK